MSLQRCVDCTRTFHIGCCSPSLFQCTASDEIEFVWRCGRLAFSFNFFFFPYILRSLCFQTLQFIHSFALLSSCLRCIKCGATSPGDPDSKWMFGNTLCVACGEIKQEGTKDCWVCDKPVRETTRNRYVQCSRCDRVIHPEVSLLVCMCVCVGVCV